MDRDETSKGLEDFLNALRSSEPKKEAGAPPPGPAAPAPPEPKAPAAPQAPRKPPAAPVAPVPRAVEPEAGDFTPPAPPQAQPAKGEPGVQEFLMRRIEQLERVLREERERASAADSRAARQEGNRAEVEEQLKNISELLRHERETAHARGRIEALEARLDKMHEAWNAALEKLSAMSAAAHAPAGPDPAQEARMLSRMEQLETRLLQAHQSWEAALQGLERELSSVRERTAAIVESLERPPSAADLTAAEAERSGLARELKWLREFFEKGLPDLLDSSHSRMSQTWTNALGRVAAAQTAAAADASREAAELKAELGRLAGISERLTGLELDSKAERGVSAAMQASLKRLADAMPAAVQRMEAARADMERGLAGLEAGNAGIAESLAKRSDATARELQALTAGIRSLIGHVAEVLRRTEEGKAPPGTEPPKEDPAE